MMIIVELVKIIKNYSKSNIGDMELFSSHLRHDNKETASHFRALAFTVFRSNFRRKSQTKDLNMNTVENCEGDQTRVGNLPLI